MKRLQSECPENPLKKIILLNANASDIVPLRKWPLENFVELGKQLLENSEFTIVLTGSPEENDVCMDLAMQINPNRTVNFAGQTSFKELITLYSISDLLITNDSGPVHFASTTEIPIMALFWSWVYCRLWTNESECESYFIETGLQPLRFSVQSEKIFMR